MEFMMFHYSRSVHLNSACPLNIHQVTYFYPEMLCFETRYPTYNFHHLSCTYVGVVNVGFGKILMHVHTYIPVVSLRWRHREWTRPESQKLII
jgi:hypothetical protein